jgi:uncharacterized membrane protein YhhN
MKKILFTFLFILSVIGVFTGIVLHEKWLDYLCKPLIMISVGGYFLLNTKNIDKKVVRFSFFAFLFSLFGDSFLMFPEFFIPGLASFFVAQIFYIFLFQRTIKISGGNSFLRQNYYWLFGYVIYGLSIYFLLFKNLDFVLKIAVFMYMLALLGMSAMALNRYKTVSSASFKMVFYGSVLFVVSDSLIALDKFFAPIPNDRIFVMSTYIAAQYLIMRGILKQFEKEIVN